MHYYTYIVFCSNTAIVRLVDEEPPNMGWDLHLDALRCQPSRNRHQQ